MKTWYLKSGFDENPFDTDPEVDEDLVEYQDIIEDLIYRVEASSMVFIEAPAGMGKTAAMVQLIKAFEGKGKVIYYDCSELKKKVEIDHLMRNRYGVFGRMFNVVPKEMIVLLDNVSELSRENAERIKYFFDQNYIRSVVFTGENFATANLPKSIKDRIGIHIVRLRPLSDYGAVELVAKRLGEMNSTISDEAVKFIFSKSNRNTKKFLMLSQKVFESLMPRQSMITLEDAKKVLRNA